MATSLLEWAAVPPALLLFIAAGLCEIGGGYLVWLWLRDHRSALLGARGGLALFLYGMLPTHFSRRNSGQGYAAYGGVFVVLSPIRGGERTVTGPTHRMLSARYAVLPGWRSSCTGPAPPERLAGRQRREQGIESRANAVGGNHALSGIDR